MTEVLKLLTYNINLNRISASAPSDWTKDKNKELIKNKLLELNPDSFSLQEIPGEEFCKQFSDQYQFTQLVPSHSGFSSTFVKCQFKILEQIVKIPFSGCKINFNGEIITLLGGHLFPFENNFQIRYDTLKKLNLERYNDESLIVFGDMNMRENETTLITDEFRLQDAFITMGRPSNEQFTWDSNRNIFWKDGYSFVARFDRIFYKNLRIKDFRLIFNQPISLHKNHFLSDHFGILASFKK